MPAERLQLTELTLKSRIGEQRIFLSRLVLTTRQKAEPEHQSHPGTKWCQRCLQ